MKKKCLLIIITFIFTIVVFIYGLWFVYDKTVKSMGILMLLIALLCLLFSYCSKKTTFPEGYTLIQAFLFYRRCAKSGVNPSDVSKSNIELMKRIAKEKGVLNDLNEEALRKMYRSGKEVETVIIPWKKVKI